MNVIRIFSRFFKRVGKVYVQLLLNDNPYIFAMFITYVGVRNDYKYFMWYS
jgi:hypothetical protein